MEDDRENNDLEIEETIERNVFKTQDQKIQDFNDKNPNILMINGGTNDVYQAVL